MIQLAKSSLRVVVFLLQTNRQTKTNMEGSHFVIFKCVMFLGLNDIIASLERETK